MTRNKDSRRRALLRRHYPEVAFGGFMRVNALLIFYSQVNALLTKDATVLDVGCGRGAWLDSGVDYLCNLRNLRGKCAKVIGLDVSDAGHQNASLDEFRLLDIEQAQWPVEDASIDLLVSDSVIEHILDPKAFFDECRRVLKPDGVICIRTYNVWHYNRLTSLLVPNRLHEKVLRRVQPHRRGEDVFPTYFKCNTRRRMQRAMRASGLDGYAYCHEGQPAYLSFSPIAYWLGVCYQRHSFEAFKWNLFAFARPQK